MTLRDFGLFVLICLVWASNNIVSKYVVAVLNVPPFFYASLRFVIVAVLLSPWLRPIPRPFGRLAIVAVLMGCGNFGLMFVGLKTAAPSAAAVVMQLSVPITTLLSWIMLGERLNGRRLLGVSMAFAGAMAVIWDPHGVKVSLGLLYILAATALGALGAVMMKQIPNVRPLQYQAWVGFISVWPMIAMSLLLETGQWEAASAGGWRFAAAVLFSAIVVSITVHTIYFWLIQRYEANLIAPLTLMTPLGTIVLGVLIFHDRFDLRMAIGTLVALVGVVVIALRPNQAAMLLMRLRSPPPA